MQGNQIDNILPDGMKEILPHLFDHLNEETRGEAAKEKYGVSIATTLSLRFQGNSRLLAGFYDAIENKIIKWNYLLIHFYIDKLITKFH